MRFILRISPTGFCGNIVGRLCSTNKKIIPLSMSHEGTEYNPYIFTMLFISRITFSLHQESASIDDVFISCHNVRKCFKKGRIMYKYKMTDQCVYTFILHNNDTYSSITSNQCMSVLKKERTNSRAGIVYLGKYKDD